ncbi:MAG: hypothetical protein JWO31_1591 [Phycisphaerales bacterium]|nr:hypothetical protein [Phycisphaerales bacterium]
MYLMMAETLPADGSWVAFVLAATVAGVAVLATVLFYVVRAAILSALRQRDRDGAGGRTGPRDD